MSLNLSQSNNSGLLVSVIVPAHNAEETIAACIQSICESTYNNYEIIVVSDGSTDRTAAVARTFDDVTVLEVSLRSSAGARNAGAEIANGTYFFFLDSDVTIPSDAITKYIETIQNNDIVLVTGRYSRRPLNPSFFTKYKALFEFCYVIPPDRRNTIMLDAQMSGGGDFYIAAVFRTLGGYDQSYTGASIEREELYTRVISNNLRMAVNTTIANSHHFPGFVQNLKNFRDRTVATAILMHRTGVSFSYMKPLPVLLPLLFVVLGIAAGVWSGNYIPSFFGGLVTSMLSSRDLFSQATRIHGLPTSIGFIPIHLITLFTVAFFGAFGMIKSRI